MITSTHQKHHRGRKRHSGSQGIGSKDQASRTVLVATNGDGWPLLVSLRRVPRVQVISCFNMQGQNDPPIRRVFVFGEL